MKTSRAPESTWRSRNPVLGLGDDGIETDTNRRKVGDGHTPWNDLAYRDPQLSDRARAMQAINGALGDSTAFDALLHRFTSAVARTRTSLTVDATSADVASLDGVYGEALAALTALEQQLRPALEGARARAAALADEMALAERAAVEQAAEVERQRRFEAAVAAEVDRAEEERLQTIRAEARKRLATAR